MFEQPSLNDFQTIFCLTYSCVRTACFELPGNRPLLGSSKLRKLLRRVIWAVKSSLMSWVPSSGRVLLSNCSCAVEETGVSLQLSVIFSVCVCDFILCLYLLNVLSIYCFEEHLLLSKHFLDRAFFL